MWTRCVLEGEGYPRKRLRLEVKLSLIGGRSCVSGTIGTNLAKASLIDHT